MLIRMNSTRLTFTISVFAVLCTAAFAGNELAITSIQAGPSNTAVISWLGEAGCWYQVEQSTGSPAGTFRPLFPSVDPEFPSNHYTVAMDSATPSFFRLARYTVDGASGSSRIERGDPDTPNTLIYFGTEWQNRIIQYGGNLADFLSVETGAGADWSEQFGGDGDDTLVADTGTEGDHIYQDGGSGNNSLTAFSEDENDRVTQIGGSGRDSINAYGGEGDDYTYQSGGAGNDTIYVTLGYGNDTAVVVAGPGDDLITYDVDPGTDTAQIDGGAGIDTLIVNNRFGGNPSLSILIRDTNGKVIYQYGVDPTTTITVIDVEHGQVKAGDGAILYEW